MALVDLDGSIDLKDDDDNIVVKITFAFDEQVPEEQRYGFVGTLGQIVQRELATPAE